MPVMCDANCLTAAIQKFEPIGSGSEASCAEPPAADSMRPPDRFAARNARHAVPRRHSAAPPTRSVANSNSPPAGRAAHGSESRSGRASAPAQAFKGAGA